MANEEIGKIGQYRWGGLFSEEFLKELQGHRGIRIYKEMSENDDIIGAILFAIEMLIRQAHWRVQPAGDEPIDNEAAEFVESCMDDMQSTWTDTISEILSFLTYGWSAHEIVYKRRMGRRKDHRLNSKYDDGLIGWMKLPIRSQDSLYQWEYDENDNLVGMTQMPAPSYKQYTIPIDKLLLFRTKSRKDNPEGRSILRNCFRDWYFKKRIQEIEGIGIERDLAGFPVLIAPEGVDIWNGEDPDMVRLKNLGEGLVRNIRRDSSEGIVMPQGWKLELLASGSKRNFDTNQVIERYDSRIAMTVLADFVLMGHQQVGSFALSSNKTELFSMAIGSYLDAICQVFNSKAIPQLIDINEGKFAGITDYPKLAHGDIESQDLSQLGDYIQKMTGVGLITPDPELEDYLREQAGLPEKTSDNTAEIAPVASQGAENEEGLPDIPAEDEKAQESARKRLGR